MTASYHQCVYAAAGGSGDDDPPAERYPRVRPEQSVHPATGPAPVPHPQGEGSACPGPLQGAEYDRNQLGRTIHGVKSIKTFAIANLVRLKRGGAACRYRTMA